MYPIDNQDRIVPNYLGTTNAWIGGSVASMPGATNELDIRNGRLFPYNTSTEIYKCPSDLTGLKVNGRNLIRARSYSINGQMGGDPAISFVNPGAPPKAKMDQINQPSPSQAMVFVDENADSIDDGYFAVQAAPPLDLAEHGSKPTWKRWRTLLCRWSFRLVALDRTRHPEAQRT